MRAYKANVLVPRSDKLKLRKHGLIESVNDLLTSVLDVSHTQHRSSINTQVNILGG